MQVSVAARRRRAAQRSYSVRMAWPPRLATALALMTALALVVAGGLAVLALTRAAWLAFGLGLVVALPASVIGIRIARTPGSQARLGVLVAALGAVVAVIALEDAALQVLAARPDAARSAAWAVAVMAESAFWLLAVVGLLLLHFPDGELPSRRWRPAPPILIASAAILHLHGAFDTVPFRPPLEGLERPFPPAPLWFQVIGGVALVAILITSVSTVVSLVIRYRRGSSSTRRRIRWLALSGLLVISYPLICLVEIAIWGEPMWMSVGLGLVGLVTVPVTAGIGILKPDLYDVDKALAATITWTAVTAGLLLLYGSTAAGLGVFLGRESASVAAVVTVLVVVVLAPLRSRLQRRVDRRFFPLRRAALDGIDGLHRDITTGRRVPEELQSVLRVALRDPQLEVGYLVPQGGSLVTSTGSPLSAEMSPVAVAPVVIAGAEIGTVRSTSPDVSPELLHDVAGRAGAIVDMVRHRMGLAHALREVESSRSRLVQIGYQERKRLERDLHDGAQQRLVSLGVSIRLAQRHLQDGTVDVDDLLDACVAELGTAVAELRQLAHGIRPSSLDDGLPAAIARLVRNVPVAVDLDVAEADIPDDIATTAYFVISEALANAVKHAGAGTIGLQVRQTGTSVVVRVRDDGCGGAQLSAASGLADRVAALGGRLKVDSPPGAGTVVEAELPCAS